MPLKITSLDQLDADLVAQAQAELIELLQEKYPEVELTRGLVRDLVGYFAGGISGGINQTEINRVLDSRSLLAIQNDPTLADDEIVDHLLSNFGVTRQPGVQATGTITVVVSANTTTVIPAGAVFNANGLTFLADDAFTARPVGVSLQSDTDRSLQSLSDGTYLFTIRATAEEVGAQGNVKRGTRFTMTSPPSTLVTTYATADFRNGSDTELNAALINRLVEGVSAKTWSNRSNIVALLKAQEDFAETLAYSIVGYGNEEMQRDQHWIFPVSGGGRTDVYARTRHLPQSVAIETTATLVDIVADGGIWQINISRDDAPGFYEVDQILRPEDPADSAGFEVTQDLRSYDLDGTGSIPDIVSSVEAAYTRYQTAAIQFLDTETPTTGLTVNSSTAEYVVTLRTMPLIDELQDFANSRAYQPLGADVLIKAAVPCFLTVNFDIQQAQGETSPDVDEIRNALSTAVNALGFPGQLNASYLSDIVHNFLTTKQAIGHLSMRGRIRRPDGTMRYVNDTSVLQIPNDPGNLITGRTTGFILYPDDIGISVVTEGFIAD